jgi:glycosyltransferase involved in cell wall biosynthesis
VEAARRYAAAHPRTCFVMVGGPLTEEIRQRTADLPQLRLLGHREDVPHLLQALDVYVSTAAWAGLGRSLTEAMIAGRPVIATDVGGVAELVRTDETGILVPPNDAEPVLRALERMLGDREYAARMGRSAHREVVPRFSADEMVRGIDDLYVELLRRKGVATAPMDVRMAAAAAG